MSCSLRSTDAEIKVILWIPKMSVNQQKISVSVSMSYIMANPYTSTFKATTKDAGVWGNVEVSSKVCEISIGQVHVDVALRTQVSRGRVRNGLGYLLHLASFIQQRDSTRGTIAIKIVSEEVMNIGVLHTSERASILST